MRVAIAPDDSVLQFLVISYLLQLLSEIVRMGIPAKSFVLLDALAEIGGGIRSYIDRGLTWLVDRAVSAVQSLLRTLGVEETAAEEEDDDEEEESSGEGLGELFG